MSYSKRRIDLTFQLGKGSFGEGGFDTLSISGLRTSARITKAGGASMALLSMRVYGMRLSDMNKLSTLGKPLTAGRNNVVTVQAGSDTDGMATAFQGTISAAWSNMQDAPNSAMEIQAHTGLIAALKPVQPSSFKGAADVGLIMSGLAKLAGFDFENNGVSVQLANPYFSGSARQQIEACARAANINWIIDDNKLAIWPKGGSRGGLVPLISKDTGMVGYPAQTDNGIAITTLYNPQVAFGSKINVQSSITPANGIWAIFSLAHDLEAEVPNGKWFTSMQCQVLGHTALPNG